MATLPRVPPQWAVLHQDEGTTSRLTNLSRGVCFGLEIQVYVCHFTLTPSSPSIVSYGGPAGVASIVSKGPR